MDRLRNLCVEILDKLDVSHKNSLVVADSLVEANLRGVDSHGVTILKFLVERIKSGTINPNVKTRILRESDSIALLDGELGFGQVVGVEAMAIAVKKAKKTGIGVVSVRNANHYGISSSYPTHALSEDMIGIVMCNSGPAMVPFGGSRPALGTNPICFAIPAGEEKPIILDMATTVSAYGKISAADLKGEKIPAGWAVDSDGRPTTDPGKALRGGLLPMGGAKGYGLAIVIDILSGILSGWAFGKQAKAYLRENTMAPQIGQLFMALNIESFTPVKQFKDDVDQMIRDLKSTPPAPGFSKVFVPGELEFLSSDERSRNGIPVDEKTWEDITSLALHLNVDRHLIQI